MGGTTLNSTPAATDAKSAPIGTFADGSRGLLALAGVAWLAWIGFLVFVVVTRA